MRSFQLPLYIISCLRTSGSRRGHAEVWRARGGARNTSWAASDTAPGRGDESGRTGVRGRASIGYRSTKSLVNGRNNSARGGLFPSFSKYCPTSIASAPLSSNPKIAPPVSTFLSHHRCRISSCGSGVVSIYLGLVGGKHPTCS